MLLIGRCPDCLINLSNVTHRPHPRFPFGDFVKFALRGNPSFRPGRFNVEAALRLRTI